SIDTSEGVVVMEAAPRPYPAAGGLYELELYVVVNRCENVDPGFYYYDLEKHNLVRISNRTENVDRLLKDAGRSAGIEFEQLQVMIIISARFQRLSWKYS